MLVIRSTNNKIAMIETISIRPYDGAKFKRAFRLSIYDQDSILYHVSVYEHKDWALDQLKEYCFEIKEMEEA